MDGDPKTVWLSWGTKPEVVFSFFALVPLLVPLPFMLLGLLICLIQALVFCTLTMVYISMAIEHEHDDHH